MDSPDVTLLKCAVSVMHYLMVSGDELHNYGSFTTPATQSMNDQLAKLNMTRIDEFVLHLNETLQIMPTPLWGESCREFFSDDHKSYRFLLKAVEILIKQTC